MAAVSGVQIKATSKGKQLQLDEEDESRVTLPVLMSK